MSESKSTRRHRRRTSLADRFQAQLSEKNEQGCILWKGYLSNGYGKIKEGPRGSRSIHAHRVAWMLAYGPIPSGKSVLHRCDVRNCVNPEHLFLGSHQDNMTDMVRKKRQACGSRSGLHKLTEEAVLSMRNRYSSEDVTKAQLSRDFQISDTIVGMILDRRRWSHV